MTEFQKQERGVKKMKIVAKIIALASIFSLVLSYSSLVSSLQQSLHLLSMYINLVDKKYMFLLCNGIVGFIMGNFKTLLHGTAMNIVEETEELRINHTRKSEMKNVVALLGEQRVSKKEEGEVVALLGVQRVSKGEGVVALNGELCVSKEEEDGEERVDLLREEEVIMVFEDDNGGKDLTVITIDEHDDDDEINDNLLSSEDLNKKCEEFIRKMKAGIRSESRKLLTS
ncbi:uncharacterized protein LOC125583693 [Brassica napus]|uniref:(rape) hypothetical protein n=1 Tax=Brassica napus TaxID=3708 RepID=A0A816IAZ4_BRANA|nr:uncharacterized protein LOC125583693 [Brassica napus]CAF1705901.1 unnamed protein product [Brassica napus]